MLCSNVINSSICCWSCGQTDCPTRYVQGPCLDLGKAHLKEIWAPHNSQEVKPIDFTDTQNNRSWQILWESTALWTGAWFKYILKHQIRSLLLPLRKKWQLDSGKVLIIFITF